MSMDRPSLTWLRGVSLACLLLLGVPSADAATIIARTDVELAQLSDAVVVGTVEAVVSELGPDGQVRTRNTLQVEDFWKGQGSPQIDVLQPGGEWEGKTTRLQGDFRLEAGKRVVMFLVEGPDGFYSTLLSWSVFDVDGAGIFAPVTRQGGELEVKKRGPDGHLTDASDDDGIKSVAGLKVTVESLANKGAR